MERSNDRLRTPREGPKEGAGETGRGTGEVCEGHGEARLLRAGLRCRGQEFDWRLGLGLPGKTNEIQRESGEGPVKVRREDEASELTSGERIPCFLEEL